MTTYTFPDISPKSMDIDFVSNTKTFVSPLTGAVQTVSRPGERWMFTLNYRSLFGDDRADLLAFLVKLNGQEHRASIPIFGHTQRGAGGGTAVVDGGSQTGSSLDFRNGPTSTTNFLRAGDWVQLSNQLLHLTDDVDTDGSGDGTLNFLPKIRTSPSDGASLTYADPLGLFLLAEPNISWSTVPGIFSDISVRFLEDI